MGGFACFTCAVGQMLVFTLVLTLAHHGHFPQGSNRSLQVAACCWMSQMHLGTVCLCLDVPHPSREENSQGLCWSLSFSVPSKSLLNLGSVTRNTLTWSIQPHKHQAGLTDTDITSVNLKKRNKKLNTHTNKKQDKTQKKVLPQSTMRILLPIILSGQRG